MKTSLILSLLLCQFLFLNVKLSAQAHSSSVFYKDGEYPAVSIKVKAPFDLTKVVLEEKLRNSGLVEKGKLQHGFRVYEDVIFAPFGKEKITCYTVVEKFVDEKFDGCIVSFLVKKAQSNAFVNESTDKPIMDNIKLYLNGLDKEVEKTFLEVQIADQTKLFEKTEKQLLSLEKDSVYVAQQLIDYRTQAKELLRNLDEKRKELKSQQILLNELSSKRKKEIK